MWHKFSEKMPRVPQWILIRRDGQEILAQHVGERCVFTHTQHGASQQLFLTPDDVWHKERRMPRT